MIKSYLRKKKVLKIQDFAHRFPNYLVIIADPKDDSLFMSYKHQQVSSKIKSVNNKCGKIVARVLKNSTFKSKIDQFLAGLILNLNCPVDIGNQLYLWIDGAVHALSKKTNKTN